MGKWQSKEEGNDQESVQSRTRPDPGYHMVNCKNTRKHYTKYSQEINPFQEGRKKQTRQYDKDKYKTQKEPQNRTALERPVRKVLEDLNMFDGTNLPLICDVDPEMYFSHQPLIYRCIIS